MKREDVAVAVLAGAGVVLVVLLVLTASGRGPLLAAASTDRTNGFVAAAGTLNGARDVMYLVDERSGQMAVFLFGRSRGPAVITDVRDLRADFAIRIEGPAVDRPVKPPEK